jgi:hypothetical protein
MDLMNFINKPPLLFIKEDLIDLLNFKPMSFEFFLKQINIGDSSKEQIREILAEARRVPAALGGYHGDYEGGLYDHILLVTNLVFQIRKNADFLKKYVNWSREKHVDISENYNDIDLPKALQTAIYHDFGKVPYYSFRLDLQYRKIYTNRVQKQEASLEITEKFNYVGYDPHVDECIAVLKRYKLPFDDEILQAIIFHHGKWSKYKPFEPTKLSELIHVADMIASHAYEI